MGRILLIAMGTVLLLASQPQAGFAASYDDASKAFKQGNYADALEKVETVIAANPRDARARFLKGLILTEQNKPADAIKVFTALTEDYPELPEPYNNLAVLYASQGQYEKARKSLEMAIRTHPSYAIAHENLGDVYAKMASEAYDKALQLDRSNAAAQTKLAMIKDLFSGSVVPGKGSPETETAANTPANTPASTPDKPAATSTKPAASVFTPAKGDPEAVLAAVNGWAKAWSGKNPDAYLAYYAPNFQVPGGEARANWETTRRDRIVRPKMIEVTIGSPKVTFDASGRAIVKFRQGYRSDTLNTSGAKTLLLVKNSDRWQILQERMN
ncbi:MAG TPA: tetratricopeptide repeat protein [Burkholderiales bacterium]|nr:tetratricopeptide repeat protein [Burkholderiales bacterium]